MEEGKQLNRLSIVIAGLEYHNIERNLLKYRAGSFLAPHLFQWLRYANIITLTPVIKLINRWRVYSWKFSRRDATKNVLSQTLFLFKCYLKENFQFCKHFSFINTIRLNKYAVLEKKTSFFAHLTFDFLPACFSFWSEWWQSSSTPSTAPPHGQRWHVRFRRPLPVECCLQTRLSWTNCPCEASPLRTTTG